MSQLHDQLSDIREHATPQWGDEAIERALKGVPKRRAVRRRQAAIKAAAVAALILVIGSVAAVARDPSTAQAPSPVDAPIAHRSVPPRAPIAVPGPEQPAPDDQRTLALEDGSRITTLVEDTPIAISQRSPRSIVVEMGEGKARYVISRHPERTFRVEAMGAAVEVLGTIFVIETSEREVRVEVEEGTVRVEALDQEPVVLRAPDTYVITLVSSEQERAAHEARATRRPRRAPSSSPSHDIKRWRALVRGQKYAQAYEHMPARAQLMSADDLMLAADVMRFTGRHDEAIKLFEIVAKSHAKTTRAGTAQFEIGRILERRRDMRGAARAFGRVGDHNAPRATAEDALVRQIRAWHYAGDHARARAQATRYLELYPDGYRVEEVRRYGGLDDEPASGKTAPSEAP